MTPLDPAFVERLRAEIEFLEGFSAYGTTGARASARLFRGCLAALEAGARACDRAHAPDEYEQEYQTLKTRLAAAQQIKQEYRDAVDGVHQICDQAQVEQCHSNDGSGLGVVLRVRLLSDRLAAVERERAVMDDQLIVAFAVVERARDEARRDVEGALFQRDFVKAERDVAQAEVAQLRAALQEIHDILDRGDSPEDLWRIARAALRGEGP